MFCGPIDINLMRTTLEQLVLSRDFHMRDPDSKFDLGWGLKNKKVLSSSFSQQKNILMDFGVSERHESV